MSCFGLTIYITMPIPKVYRKFLISILTVITFILFSGHQAVSAEVQDIVDTRENSEVLFYQGDLVSLKVYSLTRVAISKAGIVDIVDVDVDKILLVGQQAGETTIFIWDEHGKRAIVARVFEEDLSLIATRIKALLDSAGISGVSLEENKYEGKIIVTGKTTKQNKEVVSELLKDFDYIVIDMVKEAGDLIQIDVQISELSTTIQKELGFDWTAGTSSSLTVQYEETLPTKVDGGVNDLFKLGPFNRTTAILSTVNALISEGKGRILSNPSLVVTDGEEASFNVGGEIPIRTTTVSGDNANVVQEDIAFRTYGITVTVTPQIRDGKLDITLDVDIKDVDQSTKVGDDVGYTTRTMQTKLFLNDGQTIVIAGLIKTNHAKTVTRVPFLSKLPLAGWIFRKTDSPETDLEVVIAMTPRIMTQEKEEKAVTVVKKIVEPAKPQALGVEDEAVITKEKFEDVMAEIQADENFEETGAWEIESLDEIFDMREGPLSDITGEDISYSTTMYAQSIQQRISQAVSFPYEAKQRGWEGTVTLTLVVLSDGTLSDLSVKESSGHDMFDNNAVDTTQILAPFDPFPAELSLEELVITIPIVYSIGSSGNMR